MKSLRSSSDGSSDWVPGTLEGAQIEVHGPGINPGCYTHLESEPMAGSSFCLSASEINKNLETDLYNLGNF